MPIRARTADDVRREVLRRAHRGELRKVIEIDGGLSSATVVSLTSHLPGKGSKRDARTRSILAALEGGETYPPAVATATGATVREVVNVMRAVAEEQRLFPEGVS